MSSETCEQHSKQINSAYDLLALVNEKLKEAGLESHIIEVNGGLEILTITNSNSYSVYVVKDED